MKQLLERAKATLDAIDPRVLPEAVAISVHRTSKDIESFLQADAPKKPMGRAKVKKKAKKVAKKK